MRKFLRNKKGQGMSEYLIILALVAIATIGAVIFFADNVREQISNLAEEIAGGTPEEEAPVPAEEPETPPAAEEPPAEEPAPEPAPPRTLRIEPLPTALPAPKSGPAD